MDHCIDADFTEVPNTGGADLVTVSSSTEIQAIEADLFDVSFATEEGGVKRQHFVEWLIANSFAPFSYRDLKRQRTASIQVIRGVIAPQKTDPRESVRLITKIGSMLCVNANLAWAPGQRILTIPSHCGLTVGIDSKIGKAVIESAPGYTAWKIQNNRIVLDTVPWADCYGIPVAVKYEDKKTPILTSTQIKGLDWMPSELVCGNSLPDIDRIPLPTLTTALRDFIWARRLTPDEMMPSGLNRQWISSAT